MSSKLQILKIIFIFFCLVQYFFSTGFPAEIDSNSYIEPGKVGSVRIFVDIPDVKIYINSELEGLAHPQKPLTRDFVPAGTIIVTAKPKNLPSFSRPVVISYQKLSELKLEFSSKLPQEKKEGEKKLITDKNIKKVNISGMSPEQLIIKGDKYLKKERYMIPKHENAFEMYKAALQSVPDNSHAREKIYEMSEIYEKLGIEAEEKSYEKALVYYQNYITLLKYCIETFQDNNLKNLLEQALKKAGELKADIELSNSLAKEADRYFIAQKITTPKNKNAFGLYKESLKADPTNEYSLKRIKEILDLYKEQGDEAFQKDLNKKAKRLYKKYLSVAEYVIEEFGSRRIKNQVDEIEKRIKTGAATVKNNEITQKTGVKPESGKKEDN